MDFVSRLTVHFENESKSLRNGSLCFIVIKCIKIQRLDLVPTEILYTIQHSQDGLDLLSISHESKLHKMMTSHLMIYTQYLHFSLNETSIN